MSERWCKVADVVPVWFLIEESFWLFCDSGGRRWWRWTHEGTFIRFKEWTDICFSLFEGCIESEDKFRFWKSSNNAYGRFKNKMEVSFAFILSEDRTKFLLVQAVNRDQLSLPGGKCHLLEGENVTDCLFRELKEELGLERESIKIEDTHDIYDGRQFHLFLVHKADIAPPKVDRREILDYKWVTLEEVKKHKISNLCDLAIQHWNDKIKK